MYDNQIKITKRHTKKLKGKNDPLFAYVNFSNSSSISSSNYYRGRLSSSLYPWYKSNLNSRDLIEVFWPKIDINGKNIVLYVSIPI